MTPPPWNLWAQMMRDLLWEGRKDRHLLVKTNQNLVPDGTFYTSIGYISRVHPRTKTQKILWTGTPLNNKIQKAIGRAFCLSHSKLSILVTAKALNQSLPPGEPWCLTKLCPKPVRSKEKLLVTFFALLLMRQSCSVLTKLVTLRHPQGSCR